MIQAIIFDCFGVLSTSGWLPFKQRYFGGDPTRKQEVTDLRKQVDSGLSPYQEFVQKIADLSQVPLQKVHAAIEDNAPNDELFDYIAAQLKPKFKIGLLSNAARDRLDDLFGPERRKLFDAVALSFETGVTKPDSEAYSAITERLGVKPEECIFVDDQERYCTAAREAGMQAIVYKDFEQFKAEIEPLLKRSE